MPTATTLHREAPSVDVIRGLLRQGDVHGARSLARDRAVILKDEAEIRLARIPQSLDDPLRILTDPEYGAALDLLTEIRHAEERHHALNA